MTDREKENAEAADAIVAETHELAIAPVETVSLTGKKRKKRNLNLSKDQKRQIKYLRFADRVGIVFGDTNIKVSRQDSIRLVERKKAKVTFVTDGGGDYSSCTVWPIDYVAKPKGIE